MIVSTGQKRARLKNEYLHSDWISDTKVWTEDGQRGDLYTCKSILILLIFNQVVNFLKTARVMSLTS